MPILNQATCQHCGTPYTPKSADSGFCCNGCEYVYQLINEEHLERYYDLKDKTTAPIKSSVFQPQDYQWLREAQQRAEASASGSIASLNLDLQGISCIGCVWLIEKLYLRHPGSAKINLNPQLGLVELYWKTGSLDLVEVAEEVQQFGYLLGPTKGKPPSEARQLTLKIGLTGAFVLNAMLFTLPRYLGMEADFALADLFELLTLLFASLSMAIGGSYFIKRAAQSLRLGVLHIDFPIALGICAAYLGSVYGWIVRNPAFLYFDFVALFIFLMLVGRYAQEWALEKNRNNLLSARPQAQPVRLPDGEEQSAEDLKKGLHYEIAPGQQVPVSSSMESPEGIFSFEWITGESEPHLRKTAQPLPSGARNLGNQPVRLKAEEDWTDSLLSRLTRFDEEEQFRDLRFEKILKLYIIVVLILASLGLLAWAFWLNNPIQGFQTAISLLVVSCPCALGVALPLAHEMATAHLRWKGIFLRSPAIWPRLSKVSQLIFDKTGTLTYDNPELQQAERLKELSDLESSVLYHMVAVSYHPISRTLKEHLLTLYPSLRRERPPPDLEIAEIVGQGMQATSKGDLYRLGRPSWAYPPDQDQVDTAFSLNGERISGFRFSDAVRENAKEEIEQLARKGYGIWVLSGDRKSKVLEMADWLTLDPARFLFEQKPEDKADWIRKHAPNSAMMIGDGANDALAFEVAQVTATPVIDKNLLEQRCDFYFLGRGLDAIRTLLTTHTGKQKLQRRVFRFTLIYNLLAAALCLAGEMEPLLAAILMPISSLISLAMVVLHFKWNSSKQEFS